MATLIANPPLQDEKKRKFSCNSQTMPLINTKKTKMQQFQDEPLEENVDFLSLESSLGLLQTRAAQIKRDMKELTNLKRCIRETSSVKDVTRLVKNNQGYLNEINYKGSYIRCPVINWERDYGIDIDALGKNEPIEKINEQYEIVKRDKLH
jgi:hypothetical protein